MHRTLPLLVLAAATLTLAPTAARADDVSFHVNAGGELLGGGDAFSAGFRAHAGIGHSFGDGPHQPTLSIGGTLGSSVLSVDDPRALDGSVDVGLLGFGPEVTLALRFANGGAVDSRVFVSAAWLSTHLDDRLMLDAIDGVEGTQGARVALGANWIDQTISVTRSGTRSKEEAFNLFTFLLPQQLELVWERSAGSDRFGVALGWGL